MSLSVCCLTDAPGPMVRALMAQVRPAADEIVIAADSRVGERDAEDYRAAADHFLRCEYDVFGAHLAWLHAQCSCEWILRIDGDEVASPGLVAALPELTAARDARQYWFPRRWLDPGGRGWLDELPWSPDYQLRLVRNDGELGFFGHVHAGAEPAHPARYVPEPIYHLLCAVAPLRERQNRSLLYELAEPSRIAPGGGPFNATYYLPERFARRPPRPLPEADRAAVDAVLRGGESPPARPSRRHAPATETRIELLESDLRMYQGEVRGLFVEVRNGSGETWPGGLDAEPRVRLSYRWRDLEGRVLVGDGPRSPLTAPVPAGASAIEPVDVVAPTEPGHYLLEIDLVHEDVRWFGCGATGEVEVVPAGETERNLPSGLRRRLGRQRIPRVLHRVWVGTEPLPEEHRLFAESWERLHPHWEQRTWTDADLQELPIPEEALRRARHASEISNLVRFHVLALHGGVYVDTDVECLRPLDPLLRGVEAFAAFTRPGRVGTGLIGAVPGHPAFRRAAELSLLAVGLPTSPSATGPHFLTHVLWEHPEVTLFPRELFSPYLWDEPRPASYDGAYAVHHWAMSWRER